MASPLTPKKRKSKPSSPNPYTKTHNFPLEPSPNLFPSSCAELVNLFAVIAVAASVAVSCNFAITYFNQQPKPFCDSIASFDYFISNECEPCPSNGICNEGKLNCLNGYRKVGKLCVEDGEINETARKLSKLVQVYLCEQYAQSLCSGTGQIWASKDDIWERLDEYKHGFEEPAYNYAKQKAINAISTSMESRITNQKIEEFKCPETLVKHYKTLTCRVQEWIIEHALILIPVCALFMGCLKILLKVRRRYYLSIRAEELYDQVCEILEESVLSSRNINGSENDPWVVASWLRDHLLSPKERKNHLLWKKVEELIQEDSRVDRYPRIVKGESKVVWEWQVEGRLSSSGKMKKGSGSKSEGVKNMFYKENGIGKRSENFI